MLAFIIADQTPTCTRGQLSGEAGILSSIKRCNAQRYTALHLLFGVPTRKNEKNIITNR